MSGLPKILILTGLLLVVLGVAAALIGKMPGIGKLPGDILIRRGNFTFYFPLATCIVVSLFLTFLGSLFGKK